MKQNIVITIERQYGSGGRTVGEMLAGDLGIHYYDKELSKLCSEASGINEDLFIDADESIKKNKLFKPARKEGGAYKGALYGPKDPDFISMENLFNYQAKVLKDLAETESCVIIGRCANHVLKDYENVTSVFVHAPMDFLIEQAEKKQSRRGEDLVRYINTTNRNRADYYEYYTGHRWSRALNYDLCLDCSKLGFEKCVEQILAYLTVRYGSSALDNL